MDGRFREALLKQDGIEPGALPASEREKVVGLITRERTGVRWLKGGTLAAWILAVAVFIVSGVQAHVLRNPELYGAALRTALSAPETIHKLFILRVVMPIEAVALSVWLYFRTLNRRRVQVALATCEAELEVLSGHNRPTRGGAG